MAMRIGHGYDVHRLTEGRKLILGGTEIPHTLGLLGHSDADVLTHALADAILGALADGDIGRHFPDSDPRYAGISSLLLLEQVCERMRRRGFAIENADCTVIAQAPKLAPYIESMKANLCAVLSCDDDRLNVKATTEEHLGFSGREEGIAAHAVVLLRSVDEKA